MEQMIRSHRTKALLLGALLCCWCEQAFANLVANGGFEEAEQGRASGWAQLWTREPACGQAALDKEVRHGGDYSVRIEHTGAQDWSFSSEKRLDVKFKAGSRPKGRAAPRLA
jgi:hypothetical protein